MRAKAETEMKTECLHDFTSVCVSVGVSKCDCDISSSPRRERVCYWLLGRVQKLKIMQIEVQLQHAKCNRAPDGPSGMSSRQRWRKGSREEGKRGRGKGVRVEQTANSCFWLTATILRLPRPTLCAALFRSLTLPATKKSLEPGPLMMPGI